MNQSHWAAMRAHVESCLPLEACGLLAGHGDYVSEVIPITNQAHSTTVFRMNPLEQVRAFDRMERDGLDLIGIFHSHPAATDDVAAPAVAPSATDIAEAAYPAVQVVWSRPHREWEAHAFWIEDGHVTDVALHIGSGT
jgi:proteasome lid subunit RPN8/RPN11